MLVVLHKIYICDTENNSVPLFKEQFDIFWGKTHCFWAMQRAQEYNYVRSKMQICDNDFSYFDTFVPDL